MKTSIRTSYCTNVSESAQNQKVTLTGWASTIRDHGGIIFIDLRDRTGIVQIVSDPVNFREIHNLLEQVKNEYVLKVSGTVRLRSDESINNNISTGKIIFTLCKKGISSTNASELLLKERIKSFSIEGGIQNLSKDPFFNNH